MAPPASAISARNGGRNVHISGYGRAGRCRVSPIAHTLTALAHTRGHIISGQGGTSLHCGRQQPRSEDQRARRGTALAAAPAAAAYRGAVTGTTFVSARSHPLVTRERTSHRYAAGYAPADCGHHNAPYNNCVVSLSRLALL